MTPRRMIALLAVIGVAWIGDRYVVPRIAEMYVRRALAANGYPDATLQVDRVGMDHTEMSSVVLGPGLRLGDVGIDVGVSYLWGERAHELSIRHARVDVAALAGRPSTTKKRRGPKLPAERITIDDAVVTNGATQAAVSGQTAPAADGTIELSFEARSHERGRPAWTAKGAGTITVSSRREILDVRGHADLSMPEAKLGTIEMTDARVRMNVSRRELGPWKLRVTGARARVAGGEISVDPFDIVAKHPTDVVVHARGLKLEKLPGRGKIEASGVVDGRVAIRAEGGGISPIDGELRARAGGRIRLTDPEWRRRVAGTSGGGLEIRKRVAGALTDLDVSKLTVTLSPPGANPELRIALTGRGHDRKQELHLDVNLRGIRNTFHRFINPTTPRNPP